MRRARPLIDDKLCHQTDQWTRWLDQTIDAMVVDRFQAAAVRCQRSFNFQMKERNLWHITDAI